MKNQAGRYAPNPEDADFDWFVDNIIVHLEANDTQRAVDTITGMLLPMIRTQESDGNRQAYHRPDSPKNSSPQRRHSSESDYSEFASKQRSQSSSGSLDKPSKRSAEYCAENESE